MKEYKEPFKEPLFNFEEERVELPESFKIICCPNCSTEIPADNLNIAEKIGKCGSCQGVFSIQKDISGLQNSPKKIKQEILRPEGIELFHFRDELEISFDQPMAWLEWGFLILYSIFFIVGVGMSTEMGIILPFISLSVLPSVFSFFYYLRKKAKHRVFISIDDQYLNIMWRPKKLHIDQSYSIKDIQQAYVKYNPNIGLWVVYMIADLGKGQKHIKLASVKTASKAKYLEQEIESHLNIQDVVVPEES